MPRKPLRTVAELLAALPPEQRAELFDCTPATAVGQPIDDSRSVMPGRTTSIKIAGREFPSVEMVEAPDMADRVAEAMAEKYWSDFAVAWMDHPYTMKLVPKTE